MIKQTRARLTVACVTFAMAASSAGAAGLVSGTVFQSQGEQLRDTVGTAFFESRSEEYSPCRPMHAEARFLRKLFRPQQQYGHHCDFR